jgi:TBC domain-containing protein kinase-like protein
VFPIHKIIHLWDKLILGDDSYPLYIGISVLKQLKSTLLASGFNECILLFSDLPDIVMETSMIESQKMYEATPASICHRKHVLRHIAPNELDIDDTVELIDLQTEICPRISANDLVALLKEVPSRVAIVDLRSQLEFNRLRIVNSINIPFTSVSLSDIRLASLNVADLDQQLANRIVVIVSISHENAVLFAKFLVECEVARVCVLHKGFRILQTINPSILMVA